MHEHDNPPTARELAARSNGISFWACPRCGCEDWRGERNSEVERTLHPSGKSPTVRKRICRHCGQVRFDTWEVPVPPGFTIKIVPTDDEERACA